MAITLDQVEFILQQSGPLPFMRLHEVKGLLAKDPTMLLSVKIPDYWQPTDLYIENNLPKPDFDDTGFVGRRQDREALTNLIVGSYPVVTVTGEGGVGKSALALQCLYDILTKRERFDAILWTSLKIAQLTASGVRQVLTSMKDEIDILGGVASHFGTDVETLSRDELLETVIEVMQNFKLLLVVDNLETVDRDALRPLLLRIPPGSKILFTSRLGIQEMEVRYRVEPLNRQDAVRLMRLSAKLVNARELIERSDKSLETICERLFFNPLAIRWFVQAHSDGRSIKQLTDKNRDLKEVLEFCFSALYYSLEPELHRIVQVLTASVPLSEVQIAVISEIDDVERVRIALQYLYSSNLVRRTKDNLATGDSTIWTITDFARTYVQTFDRPPMKARDRWAEMYRGLIRERDTLLMESARNRFSDESFDVRSTDEATVAPLIKEAWKARNSDPQFAYSELERAAKLLPEYFEVYRARARVAAASNDLLEARTQFEKALELAEGSSAPLVLFYAQFLIQQEDFADAVRILQQPAEAVDAPQQLISIYALSLLRAGEFNASLTQYERANERIDGMLSLQQEVVFLTQYAEACRRMFEVERRKGHPREALHYIHQALQIVDRAAKLRQPDSHLRNTAGKCLNELCWIMVESCDQQSWNDMAPVLESLAGRFNRKFTSRGSSQLGVACPAIASTAIFEALFS